MSKNRNENFDAQIRVAEEDSRSIGQMKSDDVEAKKIEEGVVESVQKFSDGDGYSLTLEGGLGFGVGGDCNKKKIEPKKGMHCRIYGGFGSSFWGVELDGEEVFYRTPLERIADRIEWLALYDRDKRERWEAERDGLMSDFESLSPPLKARMERFVEKDENFWRDSGGYELYAVKEADNFVNRARQAVAAGENEEAEEFWIDEDLRRKASYGNYEDTWWATVPESAEERWVLWTYALNSEAYDYDYKRQQEITGASDGHSGNTYGAATSLACAVLKGVEV